LKKKDHGCTNLAKLSGRGDGRYRPLCWSCERRKYGLPVNRNLRAKRNYKLRATECGVCGWGEATCDLHRIRAGGEYSEENTMTLCPNCHRMVHEGKLTFI
jgi:hypothetical protein